MKKFEIDLHTLGSSAESATSPFLGYPVIGTVLRDKNQWKHKTHNRNSYFKNQRLKRFLLNSFKIFIHFRDPYFTIIAIVVLIVAVAPRVTSVSF